MKSIKIKRNAICAFDESFSVIRLHGQPIDLNRKCDWNVFGQKII